jgi:hypothetical protein
MSHLTLSFKLGIIIDQWERLCTRTGRGGACGLYRVREIWITRV